MFNAYNFKSSIRLNFDLLIEDLFADVELSDVFVQVCTKVC